MFHKSVIATICLIVFLSGVFVIQGVEADEGLRCVGAYPCQADAEGVCHKEGPNYYTHCKAELEEAGEWCNGSKGAINANNCGLKYEGTSAEDCESTLSLNAEGEPVQCGAPAYFTAMCEG